MVDLPVPDSPATQQRVMGPQSAGRGAGEHVAVRRSGTPTPRRDGTAGARRDGYGPAMAFGPREIDFIQASHSAAMITVGPDGFAKPDRVAVAVVDGKIWSSGTQQRARTSRLRLDPHCTLYVHDTSWSFLSLETTVTILEGSEVPASSLRLFPRTAGHALPDRSSGTELELDESDFLQAMIDDDRLIYQLEKISRTHLRRVLAPPGHADAGIAGTATEPGVGSASRSALTRSCGRPVGIPSRMAGGRAEGEGLERTRGTLAALIRAVCPPTGLTAELVDATVDEVLRARRGPRTDDPRGAAGSGHGARAREPRPRRPPLLVARPGRGTRGAGSLESWAAADGHPTAPRPRGRRVLRAAVGARGRRLRAGPVHRRRRRPSGSSGGRRTSTLTNACWWLLRRCVPRRRRSSGRSRGESAGRGPAGGGHRVRRRRRGLRRRWRGDGCRAGGGRPVASWSSRRATTTRPSRSRRRPPVRCASLYREGGATSHARAEPRSATPRVAASAAEPW